MTDRVSPSDRDGGAARESRPAVVPPGSSPGGASPSRSSRVVRWRPRPLQIATISLAAFLAALALLSWRLAEGEDPALGAAATANADRPARVHRKIVMTRVVHDPPPASAAPSTASPALVAAAPSTAAVPAAAAPAPSASAPAPAPSPAPAPAPAPAPPVTQTS